MNAKAKEQRQDARGRDVVDEHPDLDNCYGRIGISAVAAAVRYQGEQRRPKLRIVQFSPYDSD